MNLAICTVILTAAFISGGAQVLADGGEAPVDGMSVICHSPLAHRPSRYVEFYGISLGGTLAKPLDAYILDSDIQVIQGGTPPGVSRMILKAKTYATSWSDYHYVVQEEGQSVTYSGTFISGIENPVRKSADGTQTKLNCTTIAKTIKASALPYSTAN